MQHPEHIDQDQMHRLIREVYCADPDTSFLSKFTRSLADPAMPAGVNKHLQPHPLWLTLILIVTFVLIVFLCFSLLQPQP